MVGEYLIFDFMSYIQAQGLITINTLISFNVHTPYLRLYLPYRFI